MKYWLMKSEPDAFGIDDLKKCPKKTECWDGVRNYQARNFMRDDMKIGDKVFFYHSNCKIPGIVGTATVVSKPYPDHTAFDSKSKYFDAKSNPDNPRWFMVDIKFESEFKDVVSLAAMRENPKLGTMKILQKGNRLSITPVTKPEWNEVLKMAK